MEDVFQGWNLRMSLFPLPPASEEEPPPACSRPSSVPFSPFALAAASSHSQDGIRLFRRGGSGKGRGGVSAGWHRRRRATSLGSVAEQDQDQDLEQAVEGFSECKEGR